MVYTSQDASSSASKSGGHPSSFTIRVKTIHGGSSEVSARPDMTVGALRMELLARGVAPAEFLSDCKFILSKSDDESAGRLLPSRNSTLADCGVSGNDVLVLLRSGMNGPASSSTVGQSTNGDMTPWWTLHAPRTNSEASKGGESSPEPVHSRSAFQIRGYSTPWDRASTGADQGGGATREAIDAAISAECQRRGRVSPEAPQPARGSDSLLSRAAALEAALRLHVDPSALQVLLEMGFPETASRHSLLLHRNHIDPAVGWLVDNPFSTVAAPEEGEPAEAAAVAAAEQGLHLAASLADDADLTAASNGMAEALVQQAVAAAMRSAGGGRVGEVEDEEEAEEEQEEDEAAVTQTLSRLMALQLLVHEDGDGEEQVIDFEQLSRSGLFGGIRDAAATAVPAPVAAAVAEGEGEGAASTAAATETRSLPPPVVSGRAEAPGGGDEAAQSASGESGDGERR